MYAQERRARRELEGDDRPPEAEPCAACGGRVAGDSGPACAACGGSGRIALPDPVRDLEGDCPADLALSCGEFLRAWSCIERYGYPAWREMDADASRWGPAEDLFESLSIFAGELERLRHEDDVREARRRRETLAASRARSETKGR